MSTYSYARRVLLCTACDGVLEARVGGERATCLGCGVRHDVWPRGALEYARPHVGSIRSEAERISGLRAQDHRPERPPASLASLLDGAALAPGKGREAAIAWRGARARCRVGDFGAGEELAFLSVARDEPDPLRERAMYESALEAFVLPRHRARVLGQLARGALRDGDVASGQAWIAHMDARSEELATDSEYRVSSALLATARGDFAAVIRLLGASFDEIPIHDALDFLAILYRANAHERLGRVDLASRELRVLFANAGDATRERLHGTLALHGRYALLRETWSRVAAETEVQARSTAGAGSRRIGAILLGTCAFALVSAAAPIAISVVVALARSRAVDVGDLGATGTILGTVVLCMAPFLSWGWKSYREGVRERDAFVQGQRLAATVVGLERTGVSVNDIPEIQFVLRCVAENGQPFQARARQVMPEEQAMHMAPIGARVRVRVDPRHPDDAFMETSA